MTTLRFNNVFGTAAARNITLTAAGTTATFSAAPNFPTITAPDIAKIIVEPDSPNEEIIYVTAYTLGALTATVTRGQESSAAIVHTNVAWVHGPTAADIASAGGGGGIPTNLSVRSTVATAVTDAAATYDMPGLSIANVPAGTYLWFFSIVNSAKNQTYRVSITDGANTVLWPSGSSVDALGNVDGTLQIACNGVLVLSAITTVKVRAAAAGAIGNYTVYDRHLTLIQIA